VVGYEEVVLAPYCARPRSTCKIHTLMTMPAILTRQSTITMLNKAAITCATTELHVGADISDRHDNLDRRGIVQGREFVQDGHGTKLCRVTCRKGNPP